MYLVQVCHLYKLCIVTSKKLVIVRAGRWRRCFAGKWVNVRAEIFFRTVIDSRIVIRVLIKLTIVREIRAKIAENPLKMATFE